MSIIEDGSDSIQEHFSRRDPGYRPPTRQQVIQRDILPRAHEWESEVLATASLSTLYPDAFKQRFYISQRYFFAEDIDTPDGRIRPSTCVLAAVGNGAIDLKLDVRRDYELAVVQRLARHYTDGGIRTRKIEVVTALKEAVEDIIPGLSLDISRRDTALLCDGSSSPIGLNEWIDLIQRQPVTLNIRRYERVRHVILVNAIFMGENGLSFGIVDSAQHLTSEPESEMWRRPLWRQISLDEFIKLDPEIDFERRVTAGLILGRKGGGATWVRRTSPAEVITWSEHSSLTTPGWK